MFVKCCLKKKAHPLDFKIVVLTSWQLGSVSVRMAVGKRQCANHLSKINLEIHVISVQIRLNQTAAFICNISKKHKAPSAS